MSLNIGYVVNKLLGSIMHGKNKEGEDVPVSIKDDGLAVQDDQVMQKITELSDKTPKRHVGYSTDEKPAGKKGDSFIEMDTKNVLLHDGNDWVEF